MAKKNRKGLHIHVLYAMEHTATTVKVSYFGVAASPGPNTGDYFQPDKSGSFTMDEPITKEEITGMIRSLIGPDKEDKVYFHKD